MPTQIHIVGARPNFIKAAPVILALHEMGERPLLVHTGQHYDELLSGIFFEQLGLPKPDVDLGVGSGSHASQTAALLVAIEELLLADLPDRVIVYGDINSTVAATLAAVKLHIPVAHVEAGLRSFDRSMPEEINRVLTDALADMHFTTSPEAEGQLVSEGVPGEGVHFVGNTMIDTLLRFMDELDSSAVRSDFDLPDRYAVCTLHRPANVDDAETATQIVSALARVAEMVRVVLPLHPRGRDTLGAAGINDVKNLVVSGPIGYLEFMALLSDASLVLTDSGGIQEETTILGVPCLTLRENTERPITVTMGTNRLVGRDAERIVSAATEALDGTFVGGVPPLWDGKAGLRIAEVLSR